MRDLFEPLAFVAGAIVFCGLLIGAVQGVEWARERAYVERCRNLGGVAIFANHGINCLKNNEVWVDAEER